MDSTVQEKRRFPRKQLDKPAEVIDNDTGLIIGMLDNVSRGGFSLVTRQGIRPSEVRNVTLVLPGPQTGSHKVSLIAECVWCQSVSEKKSYAAGFMLCDIQEQDAVALNYFIRDYKVTG